MKMKLHVFCFFQHYIVYIYIYGLHPLTCHFLGKRSLSTWCPASERTGIDFFCPCLAELMYSKQQIQQQIFRWGTLFLDTTRRTGTVDLVSRSCGGSKNCLVPSLFLRKSWDNVVSRNPPYNLARAVSSSGLRTGPYMNP